MTRERAQTSLGFTVVTITKYLMEYYSIDYEQAYKKLIETDFYEKLVDLDTGLYLESISYLCEACNLELKYGNEAMYEFILKEYV